ncbi:uncharacterized protein LOC133181889 [Saccostrea echinata]|uniref:uncharacterized protein LOC133181889 n=1 Tax=Saccostrea echinata TaxID=191078 RepID=UPI002A816045|nr:uncharacterized protein LOC133181889 [Saccostrea echinata]
MAGWGAASISLKVALIVLCLAFVIFIIGFATKGWAKTEYPSEIVEISRRIPIYVELELGLWRYEYCNKARYDYRYRDNDIRRYNRNRHFVCTTNDIDLFIGGLRYCADWYRAVQAMECLGLILMAGALILLFLYFFVDSIKQKKYLYIIIGLTFGAVVCIVIGVAVFGSKIKETTYVFYLYKLGWSFGLAVAGAILAFVAGIAEIVELRK